MRWPRPCWASAALPPLAGPCGGAQAWHVAGRRGNPAVRCAVAALRHFCGVRPALGSLARARSGHGPPSGFLAARPAGRLPLAARRRGARRPPGPCPPSLRCGSPLGCSGLPAVALRAAAGSPLRAPPAPARGSRGGAPAPPAGPFSPAPPAGGRLGRACGPPFTPPPPPGVWGAALGLRGHVRPAAPAVPPAPPLPSGRARGQSCPVGCSAQAVLSAQLFRLCPPMPRPVGQPVPAAPCGAVVHGGRPDGLPHHQGRSLSAGRKSTPCARHSISNGSMRSPPSTTV